MAPPRRTSTRNASATPARSSRGGSALPVDGSATRRSIRGASQQLGPANGIVTSPNLPEVQTQQSYAYGSTKAPLLPDQLVANEKMTLQQMASTLNASIRQAEQHFEDHAAEAGANFNPEGQKDARSDRAIRRGSREGSREGSVDSDTRKTRRTAAWASSLDNSQLEDISEEGLREDETPDDDETRRGTDPSSFPSGIFDHSYNYERARRGPVGASGDRMNVISNLFSRIWQDLKHGLTEACYSVERAVLSIGGFIIRTAQGLYRGILQLVDWTINPRFIWFLVSIAVFALLLALVSAAFCRVYTSYLCNPDSTSNLHLTLTNYCGQCSLSTAVPANLTFEERKDLAKLSKTLNTLTQKIQEAEARMDAKFDAKHADLVYSIEDLDRQQRDLQVKIANIETRQPPSSDFTPLMQKINYFAPGTGALINPYRTSPTKQKQLNILQRNGAALFGLHRHTSNPPSSALEPWEDIGDCWCSADTQGSVRLGVDMGHAIYPTEVVIEHYPSAGLIFPDTAPRKIEIWADFAHVTPKKWAQALISERQGPNPLSPTMAKIGELVYDATSRNHVQTFRLDVNQGELVHSTDRITVRVVGNYGAEYTCLYRVRVHGEAVVPHAKTAPLGSEL